MVPCSTGEDRVIYCPGCGYAANQERAEIGDTGKASAPVGADGPAFEAVDTPNKRTIREVCEFLGVEESASAKLLVFVADDKPVAALLRGDHEANEAKVRRAFKATSIAPADAATIEKATGVPVGFLGPVSIKIPLVVDRAIAELPSVVVGGNAVDVHLKGVVPGRDFPITNLHDLRNAEAGDPCPRCGTTMDVKSGLEIGHVFKLGTKYSKAMGANYLDEKGNENPVIMGCYGIGINRIVAAAIETGNDENGIIWPLSLAPYPVTLIPLQVQNEAVVSKTDEIERTLTAAGIEVLVDDRDLRPGVKFKDADLIGIPLRVVIGERGLKDGKIELKWRTERDSKHLPAEGAGDAVLAELNEARAKHDAECRSRIETRSASRNG
jgi:prolyl-tRNA synthetase